MEISKPSCEFPALIVLSLFSIYSCFETIHHGKTRRKETIPITDKLAKELAGYQIFCKRYWGNLNDYVFVKRDNKQLTENALMLVFQYLQKKMNFKDVRVSAHTFRHTFCHRLAMSGMSAFY
ncbi:tyrosine-type recombinase/integrase [Neobacillus terrae]|uniref:tyrosine-type recombinase/integrase n=1 Tax=Neobacillus terrae TaxID=3034837 RepID=UPI00140C4F76|nr:phage integrase family protein [Neobacillus terrae]